MLRILALCLALLAGTARADEAAWAALAEPGAVALMRHALAPGTGDPPEFRPGDCTTQRNLDAAGRAQATAIGAALRARGIAFDRVLSSEWCRCLETAERMAMGPVEPLPALNSFFEERGRRNAQTAAVRAFLAGLPPGARVLLVTHQVNITALTGRPAASGEIVVLRRTSAGFEVAGAIRLAP